MDDTLSILASLIWLLALGMWPVGFMFGMCSACCESQCPWILEFDRCLRYRVVGSSPEIGGDCRVRSTRESDGEIRVGVGSGDTSLSISQVQSQISVPVTVTIPGLSQRTPVGEIRTERFRFNRPQWDSPFSFDVLGPPWHLEVEITVRGVASQQEQGVEPSLTEDEHGQTKLALDIKQWDSTITHTQTVTLNPIGAQRVQGRFSLSIPPFSLQDASSTAARVGTTTFPWTVVRGSVSVLQRSLAVRVAAACSRGLPGLPNAFVCDDDNVSAFLSGAPRQFSNIEITITPDNVLCGIPANRVGVGIALGAYPEKLYVELGQPLASQLCHSTHEMLPMIDGIVVSPCPNSWAVRPYRGRNGRNLSSEGTERVNVSLFWAGESLLWNLEKGHYRDSAQIGMGVVRITQPSGALPSQYDYLPRSAFFNNNPCRPGFGPGGFIGIDPICLPAIPIQGGSLTNLVATQNGFALSGSSSGVNVQALLGPVNTCDLPRMYEGLRTTPLDLPVPPFLMTLPLRQMCGPWDKTTISVDGDTVTRSCQFIDAYGDYISAPTATQQVQIKPNVSRLARKFFLRFGGFGSPDDHSLQAQVFSQPGRCRLFGIDILGAISGGSTLIRIIENGTGFWAPAAGECLHYALMFGHTGPPEDAENCIGVSNTRDSLPCDGCEPSVTIISGSENAEVRYNESGERARTIDVIAKRAWLGGQGVTFRVTCSNDTITPTIRRGNTAPEPPVGLAATRGPCDTVTLTWAAPHDGGQPITNYTVQYRTLGGGWVTLVRPASTATSAAVPGLLRVGYEFRVFATNSVGDGLPSSVIVGFFLGPPTNLVATRGPCDQVLLSWTPPSQGECIVVASYRVEFLAAGTFNWTTFATVAADVTSATVTGLLPATAYAFRVLRIDEAGTAEGFANAVQVGAAPPAPTNVVAVAGDAQATVTWSAAEDACIVNTNYFIYFRPASASAWSGLIDTGSPAKLGIVTGLTNGVPYVFSIQAFNSLGGSPLSSPSSPVTPTA